MEELLHILEIGGIVVGAVLASWGLFHQLIVGGAATIFRNITENEIRLIVMSWVAQGAFVSFVGVLTAVMLLFFGIYSPPVQIVLLLSGLALVLLSAHVFATGYSTHIGPLRTGAVLELIAGTYLLLLVLLSNPLS